MGAHPEAKASAFGLARAKALYGPLPKQLADPQSFASCLAKRLAARRKARLAEGEVLAAPETRAAGLCVLIMRLPDKALAVTVLNFGRKAAEEELDLRGWSPGAGAWTDLLTGGSAGAARDGRLRVRQPALSGTTLVLWN